MRRVPGNGRRENVGACLAVSPGENVGACLAMGTGRMSVCAWQTVPWRSYEQKSNTKMQMSQIR